MNKRQQIIIFGLVGIMLLSVVGAAALMLVGNDTSTSTSDELSDDLAEQLAELEQRQEQEAAAQTCAPLSPVEGAAALETPEVVTYENPLDKLAVEDLKVGSGAEVATGDCIVAHYHGTLASDGTVFDSSFERGSPARFSLNGVIQGWQQGIPGMKEGGIRRLAIPYELAYGEDGRPPTIGPKADLIFTVELVRIDPVDEES